MTRYTGVLLSLCSMLAVLGVIVCRHSRRKVDRPFKTPLYPVPQVIFILLMLVSIVYAVVEDWKVAVVSAGTICGGVLLYYLEKKFFKR